MSFTNGLDNPELYFQTVLWTGNGSSSRSITLDGSEDMQPDWVWIKARAGSESTQQHYVYDVVRGATKYIQTSSTNVEGTKSNGLSAFASDGFTIGDDNANNASSNTYVAWCWKAGGSSSSNSNGSRSSTVSANNDAGFSIVKWTGNNSNTTVGHGLNAAPSAIITKSLASTKQWAYGGDNLNNWNNYIPLSDTDVSYNDATMWNDTAPTSTVFTVGTSNLTNSPSDMIGYCFVEKQGFSKFGTYEGNGNSNGPFVYTGHRPAWVMTKSTDTTSNWNIFDSKRSTFNDVDDYIKANANAGHDTGSSDIQMDFLSNGFKIRGNNDEVNGSESYIFISFAESPFINSKSVPTNAR